MQSKCRPWSAARASAAGADRGDLHVVVADQLHDGPALRLVVLDHQQRADLAVDELLQEPPKASLSSSLGTGLVRKARAPWLQRALGLVGRRR